MAGRPNDRDKVTGENSRQGVVREQGSQETAHMCSPPHTHVPPPHTHVPPPTCASSTQAQMRHLRLQACAHTLIRARMRVRT